MFCFIFLLGHIVLVKELMARPSTMPQAVMKSWRGDSNAYIIQITDSTLWVPSVSGSWKTVQTVSNYDKVLGSVSSPLCVKLGEGM